MNMGGIPINGPSWTYGESLAGGIETMLPPLQMDIRPALTYPAMLPMSKRDAEILTDVIDREGLFPLLKTRYLITNVLRTDDGVSIESKVVSLEIVAENQLGRVLGSFPLAANMATAPASANDKQGAAVASVQNGDTEVHTIGEKPAAEPSVELGRDALEGPDQSDIAQQDASIERMNVADIRPGMTLEAAEQVIYDRLSVSFAYDGKVSAPEPLFGMLRAFGDEEKGEAIVLLHVQDAEQRTVVGVARILYRDLNSLPNDRLKAALLDKYGEAMRKERVDGGTHWSWFEAQVTNDPQANYEQCDRAGGSGFEISWFVEGDPVDWKSRDGDASKSTPLLSPDGPNLPDFNSLFGDKGRQHLGENAQSCFVAIHAALNVDRERRKSDSLSVTLIDYAWYKSLMEAAPETAATGEKKDLKLDL